MSYTMNEMTEHEQIILSIMNIMNMDIELTKTVMDFIGYDILNYQLFIRFFNKIDGEPSASNVSSAISRAADAKSLFSESSKYAN